MADVSTNGAAVPDGDLVLDVRDLVTHFPITAGLLRRQVGVVHAVDGVSLSVAKRETLGIVGESGCGKTTLGRSILRLIEPTSGSVTYKGTDVVAAGRTEMRELRAEMQITHVIILKLISRNGR
jgi:ABC-type oligopeptide transport system ATPase subunit